MKVNERKRGRPPKKKDGLDKALIVQKAKFLMAEKQGIPSIRALASELSVDAMAIYHYFKNKNELLEVITTSLILDMYEPKSDKDWQYELLKLCKSYLKTLDKYDGLLNVLLTMESDSPAEAFTNRFQQIITPLSLKEKERSAFLDLLVDYLHGFSVAKSCDKLSILSFDDIDQSVQLIISGVLASSKAKLHTD